MIKMRSAGGGSRAGVQAQTLPLSRRQLKDKPCRMRRARSMT
jgi:hypothetical protein